MNDAIAPAGRWRIALVEVGTSRHPGSWVGPGYPEWYWSPMNVVVLRRSDQTVLVDAGPGITGSWWPFEGFRTDTETALAAVGVRPTDVDLIVLTHLDYDHAGGVLGGTWPHDLRLAFPRAPVVVHEDAVEAARAADPDAPNNVGTRLVALLEQEGLLVPVAHEAEVSDDVRVTSAPGHRVGHMCVEVDGHDPFVHAADTFHNESHVAHPEWDTSADEDPETALATRRRVLGELADTGARAVITHMPGPHAFRIAREKGIFRLVQAKP
jgi:glyoxylase-like metal-dependent hydrolase (beta-lactamase superfamily II)